MLHARRQRRHAQVVRIGDGIDVARQPQRKRCQREALRQSAAGRAALDVEGRSARRLPNGGDDALPQPAEPLREPHRGRRLAFSQRRRRHCRHVNILGAGLTIPEAAQHGFRIDFSVGTPVAGHLFRQQAKFGGQRFHGFELRFCRLGNLPVGHFDRIQIHDRNKNETVKSSKTGGVSRDSGVPHVRPFSPDWRLREQIRAAHRNTLLR